jgi:cyclic dehypoxanthinyl futalosine synthase
MSTKKIEEIQNKVLGGYRISDEEYLILDREADLYQLGFLANSIRERLHPEGKVTYVIDRNINYTDICISACKFCAFYVAPDKGKGRVLSFEELAEKIQETQDLGGTQILLQGGLHPDLKLEYYEEMLRFMKGMGIHIHGFSPPEVHHFSTLASITTEEVLKRLMDAGLDSIPGGGAEILTDRVRQQTAPRKCSAEQWLKIMEQAHGLGLKTTATMMFGHIETHEERLEHLQKLRALQDKTKGFTAFIPWPFQASHTALKESSELQTETSVGYLKMLALSRIYLDNFKNVQASWVTQGPKVAQLSLFFGANDFGSTMIEENVVAAAGVSFRLSENEIIRLVKDAGYIPEQRLMDYSPA